MVNLNFWEKYGRTTKVLVLAGLIGIEGYLGYNIRNDNINLNKEEVVIQRIKKQSERIVQSNLALAKERTKSIAAAKEKESAIARADSASKATVALKKEKNAAVAHAQKTEREAKLTERETILGRKEQLAINYPGFDFLKDYVTDGSRSFHSDSLPWEASLRNPKFMRYFNSPEGNILDYLKIKALGDSSYVPKNSIDNFFNGKYDEYKGDILGQDVRALYHSNASDGKIYGVKLQNGKVIGLDELARQNVTYTGPSKEEIKQKIGKMNIPNGWRKMQSYQKK